ncbi:ADCY5 [Mytilus coruscus]|uniref:adenylate cyclase n=1 Tax=Mytilus coruscus TaxID=42192 RepID=A0A6J8B8C1_MYTCO|nr:ADCY5 [Mytilus coruscus]
MSELNLESFTSLTNIMELPNELKALLVTMKLDGKEPEWKFTASSDQVSVQLTTIKAKKPDTSSRKPEPALKKKNKPPSTRRHKANCYTKWMVTKTAVVPTAAQQQNTEASIDHNSKTEARDTIVGKLLTPTKYRGGTSWSCHKQGYCHQSVSVYQYNLKECLSTHFGIPVSSVNLTHLDQANISLGIENSICNPEHKTSHFPEYLSFCMLLVMIALGVFIQASSVLKLLVWTVMAFFHLLLVEVFFVDLLNNRDFLISANRGQQVEATARLDFLWKIQATEEKEQMESLRAYNLKLIANILPLHVAENFLKNQHKKDEDLYHLDIDNTGIMFASIANFNDFYIELEGNNEGVECLRLLNEIIADFDEIISEERFKCLEKIKTIGSSYMTASGLTKETNYADMRHIVALAEFAFSLREQLQYVNEHSFNNFKLRIGMNVGPIVAGVIGARKPHYDIWGNSVNVASRMDSTGVQDRIQVTQEIYNILHKKGYVLECRGIVRVKGKGEMTTYYLTDRPPVAYSKA